MSVCPGESDYVTTLRVRNTTACPKDYDYAVFQTSGPFGVVIPFGFGTVTVPAWQEVAVPIDLIIAADPPPFDATATLQAEVYAAADPANDYCSATASVRTPQTPGSIAELTDASTCAAPSGATTVVSTLTLQNLTDCTRTFGYLTSTVSTEFYSLSTPEWGEVTLPPYGETTVDITVELHPLTPGTPIPPGATATLVAEIYPAEDWSYLDSVATSEVGIAPVECHVDFADATFCDGLDFQWTFTLTNAGDCTQSFDWTLTQVDGDAIVQTAPPTGSATIEPGASVEVTFDVILEYSQPGASAMLQLDVSRTGNSTTICSKTASATALDFEYIQWVPMSGGLFENDVVNPRFFPDQSYPQDSTVPDFILIDVQVSPPVPDIQVYLRVLDVDDPTATEPPLDNETQASDNRGAHDSSIHTVITDSHGHAFFPFQVSRQPGDNFRVMGNLCTDYPSLALYQAVQAVDGSEVEHALTGELARESQLSKPLTIWRRLWIEVDSMTSEPSGYPPPLGLKAPDITEMYVQFVITDHPAPGLTTVFGAFAPDASMVPDFYEGGALHSSTGAEYAIVRSRSTGDPQYVVIAAVPASAEILEGIDSQFLRIRDDDLLLPQLPRLGGLIDSRVDAAFADCFVRILQVPPSLNVDSLTTFDLNTDFFDLANSYDNPQSEINLTWNVFTNDYYWSRRVIVAYQPESDKDHDSDEYETCGISSNCNFPDYDKKALPALTASEPARFGVTLTSYILPWQAPLSYVYVETIRDGAIDVVDMPLIVAHEVAHSTCPTPCVIRSSSSSDHAEQGIMRAEPVSTIFQLTPATRSRIREIQRW